MTAPAEAFPIIDLSSTEVEETYLFCGGDEPEIDKMRIFLENSGLPAIPRQWTREYVQALGLGCLDALGLGIEKSLITRNYNRGVLFYAGVVNMVGVAQELPVNGDVLRRFNETDRLNLGITARQDIEELPSFINLLGRYRGVLERTEPMGFEAALVGAGVAHIITRDSMEAGPTSDGIQEEIASEAQVRGMFANLELGGDLSLGELEDAFNALDGAGAKRESVTVTDEPKVVLPSLPFLGEIDRRVSKQKGRLK